MTELSENQTADVLRAVEIVLKVWTCSCATLIISHHFFAMMGWKRYKPLESPSQLVKFTVHIVNVDDMCL